jgi:hypothetical protein
MTAICAFRPNRVSTLSNRSARCAVSKRSARGVRRRRRQKELRSAKKHPSPKLVEELRRKDGEDRPPGHGTVRRATQVSFTIVAWVQSARTFGLRPRPQPQARRSLSRIGALRVPSRRTRLRRDASGCRSSLSRRSGNPAAAARRTSRVHHDTGRDHPRGIRSVLGWTLVPRSSGYVFRREHPPVSVT